MAWTGGRRTFDRLMLENLPAAQRFAIRLTGDPSAAEELAQEAIVRAARYWRTYRGQAKFRTWLFQIVVNAFRDQLSRRRDLAELPQQAIDPHSLDPATLTQAKELGEMVAALVSRLPPRQREVVVLVAFEQMQYAEVAAVLGITEQNVRTTLHLARQRLREKLAPHVSASYFNAR